MNNQLVDSILQVIQALPLEEQTLLRQKLATVSPPPANTPASLEQHHAFLKKPLTERRQILSQQADALMHHYQSSTEWRELMAGDIIDD